MLHSEMMSTDKRLPEVIQDAKRVVRDAWGNFGDSLKFILETSMYCCKKDAIERVLKNHIFNQSTHKEIMESFEKRGFRRFIKKNLMKFNKNNLRKLISTFISDNFVSFTWVYGNLQTFNEDVLRLLMHDNFDIPEYQDAGSCFDHITVYFDSEMKKLIFPYHLFSYEDSWSHWSKWVRRNLEIFNEEELRSLAAAHLDYFQAFHEKLEVSALKESSMQCTLNAFGAKNFKIVISEYCETFSQDIKKLVGANSSMFNETVLNSCNNIELIDPQDEVLETLIGDDLEKWARRCLRNIEILHMLTDNYEEKMFRASLASKFIAKIPSEAIIGCLSESLDDKLTKFSENIIWDIKPLQQLWELTQQSSILSSSTDSEQIMHVLPIFNSSNLNRLVLTFNVNPKLCKLLESFFCNDRVIHSGVDDLQIDCSCPSLKKQHSCLKNQEAIFSRDENMLKQVDNYDSIIFVAPLNMDIHPTSSAFQTAFPHIGECFEFFCVSDKEVYENLVTEKFQLNGRPFFEILKYSDSSTVNEIIELIPLFENHQTLLLVWNVEETFSKKIIHSFVQYECEFIPSTQAEPFRLQTDSREVNFLIMVCGQLKSKTHFTEFLLDAMTELRVEGSIYIVCHSINSDHIKSVFLSCKKYNFLEKIILPNLPQEPFDFTNNIPIIEANKEIEVLILTWKAPRSLSSYINDTFQNCTIRSLDQQSNFLEKAYDEVILVCCAPSDIDAIVSELSSFSSYVRSRCNFYLVGDQNYFAEIASKLPREFAFHFSLNFCFFGDSIIDQIGKVPVLKRQRDPNVLLVSLNLDKNTALEIDNKFTSYTTKHVDLMPWSSDSLSFTGSEFDKVVILCNEHTDPQLRETKSVLYSALTRAKQKATVFCHENTESHFRKLLSLSSTDQVFQKMRLCENLGENFPSCLENQYDLLEAFKRIIVSKNVAQFDSLEKFVSECTDPRFDWVFHSVQSMLLRCFPWGHEIVHMLNKFLSWRPALRSEVNIFIAPSFLCGNEAIKEERIKLLESIEMDLRSTKFAFDTMDTSKLKNLALSAVTWHQMVLFDEVFQLLKNILLLDDDFFAELLHHAIVLNEIDYVEKVIESIANRESRIFCLLKQTAPFIDEAMLYKLVTSVRIPSDVFLTQNLSEEPFQTLIHYFASTATAQCFKKLLSFLPERAVKFSAFNLQDELGRSVLMSAVCNSEIFQLILNRAEQQGDLDVLLSQKDSKGWSCLRHACNADNIDVVKLLVKKYSLNYIIDDVNSGGVQLMDFVQTLGRNYIKKFLSRSFFER